MRPGLAAALSVSAKSKYKVSVERGKAMKKIISFLLAGAVLLPGAASAAFVKSDKLFNDYDRYAVVYMDGTKRIYADTETVEQDYASAERYTLRFMRNLLIIPLWATAAS